MFGGDWLDGMLLGLWWFLLTKHNLMKPLNQPTQSNKLIKSTPKTKTTTNPTTYHPTNPHQTYNHNSTRKQPIHHNNSTKSTPNPKTTIKPTPNHLPISRHI
jgi:FtsZ-interacting cell division protein ZipA